MFWHLFRYRLKVLVKNVPLIFWTVVFPLLLGLLFLGAFSNLGQLTKLEQEKVAVVGDQEEAVSFKSILTEMESDGKHLFKVKQLTKKQAASQLADDKISGYFDFTKEDIELYASRNEVPQAVMSAVLSQYLQNGEKIRQLSQAGVSPKKLADQLSHSENFIKATESKSFSLSNFYFFTLLGMTIINGLIWGLGNNHDQQADQSANGIRICLSPRNKLLVSLSNLLASFVLFFSALLVILAVFHFIYQVDFGSHWQWVLLLTALGALAAIAFGTMVGNLSNKISFGQKISMGTTITMLMSFLAGMMGTESIKYWIDQHLPLLGRINLVNLISESFYQLHYYQSLQPFYLNLFWLVGFTVLFFLGNVYFEGRASYDHL